MKRETIQALSLWFVLTFLGEWFLPNLPITTSSPASEEGMLIDGAYRTLMIMGIPVFAFVVSVLVYAVLRFRVREDDAGDATPVRGSATVYLAWLAITTLLAIAILIHPGVTGIAELRANPTADLVVQVTAEQWNWDYTYPQYGVTIKGAQQLVLPVDRRVRFEVTSMDVVHSFWVPAFRMKIDAVPGQTTVMYVTPVRVGTFGEDPAFRVQCAELCGTGHALMRTEVQVVEPSEFEAWIAAQGGN